MGEKGENARKIVMNSRDERVKRVKKEGEKRRKKAGWDIKETGMGGGEEKKTVVEYKREEITKKEKKLRK